MLVNLTQIHGINSRYDIYFCIPTKTKTYEISISSDSKTYTEVKNDSYILLNSLEIYSQTDLQTDDITTYDSLLIIELLINIIITTFIYCIVPSILRIINGKYDYEKGRKIIIINNAIIWFICVIIKSAQGITQQSAAVIIYYYVNKFILLKENEKRETKDFKDDKSIFIKCKVCEKEIPYNNNGTCEECHQKILKRLEEKNDNVKKEYCTNCGKEINIEWKFCKHCGKEIK